MALAFPFPKIGTRTEVCFPMEMLYDLGTLQEKTPELLFTFERIIKSNKWQKILLSLLALRALWIYLWRSCLCPAEKGEGRTSLRECCFFSFWGSLLLKSWWKNAVLLTTAYLMISRWFHFRDVKCEKAVMGLLLCTGDFPAYTTITKNFARNAGIPQCCILDVDFPSPQVLGTDLQGPKDVPLIGFG